MILKKERNGLVANWSRNIKIVWFTDGSGNGTGDYLLAIQTCITEVTGVDSGK